MLGSVTEPGLCSPLGGLPKLGSMPPCGPSLCFACEAGRSGEGAAVVGVCGASLGPCAPAYSRQRCFTLALSTAIVLWSDSSCRLCSSSFATWAFMEYTSSRSFVTWSPKRVCFWPSTFCATLSLSAWIWRMAWSAVAASAFCATNSPRLWSCLFRWSTLRVSTLVARSSPRTCSCLWTCSTVAKSAFCLASSASTSNFRLSSVTRVSSALSDTSLANILMRSMILSVVSMSTFLMMESWRSWMCLANCSVLTSVARRATSSLSL
mmetsp:Transcript_47123/g.140637  ORF Transcript_47123/g.140637 Transcript_47123/m.140637 type:complete len:265 (+) Transcript_47123:86-880(+)